MTQFDDRERAFEAKFARDEEMQFRVLARRNRLNSSGASEAVFLEPLIEFALANETPAERKLKLFHGAWGGSVDPVFREFAY